MQERFFIATPTPTGRTRKHPSGNNQCPVYLDADGTEMLWSADFPIPAIGQRVYITMNRIGWAVVKGYFVSDTRPKYEGVYVGVMTLATNPPKWLREQQREYAKRGWRWHSGEPMPQWMRDGIGCEFGTEIALKNPNLKRRGSAA